MIKELWVIFNVQIRSGIIKNVKVLFLKEKLLLIVGHSHPFNFQIHPLWIETIK